jgi:hypothetical protein
MEPRKQAICDALARWIKQRPGLEFAFLVWLAYHYCLAGFCQW